MTSKSLLIAALVAVASVPLHAIAADDAPRYGSWGVDISSIDPNVRPGDDFAMYAFGKWFRDTPLPPGQPAIGPRMEMERRNDARIAAVVEESAQHPATADERLIANLYKSYMDIARIERLDATPLRSDLAAIRRLSGRAAIARQMGRALGGFGQSFFDVSISADYNAPQRAVVRLQQPRLGAGRREVYLDAAESKRLDDYRAHVARTLRLAGWDRPEELARRIVAFETRIAAVSWNNVDSNDLTKIWNVTTLSELEASAPRFPWRPFLDGAGLSGTDRFIVFQKSAFPKIAAIFAETPAETLKAWLAFSVTDAAAPYLSSRFRDAAPDAHDAGARAREAVRLVNDHLRDAVARPYMARYFRPEAKAQVETMVRFVKAAMGERIRRLDWMSPRTKEAALAKLAAIRVGIGYPDRWRDDAALDLRPDDLYGNMRRLAAFDWRWELGKLRRPVDRDAWEMAPQAVGAQAAQPRLFMLFTAGLLQPPIFDPNADPAVNFGGLGAVIGHEIGHFFDDHGSQIDAKGARRNWWTPDDAAQFQARTDRLVRQLETYHVDARRTLSEFLAHLEGLEVALDAYHLFLGNRLAPILDGYTGDQRFFLAFAQAWKAKVTPEFWRQIEDQAPPIVTVNGVVRNMDGWYSAFEVHPGDKNYLKPEDRIRIW